MQLRSVAILVVFFQASKDRIDIALVQLLAALYAYFFAKLFVVSSTEAAHWCAIDASKLATGIVVVKDVVGWILLIVSNTVSAFHNMNAIVFTIK